MGMGNQPTRSGSTADEEKIAKLTIIWEHQPTADAAIRIERAFEMLLADELDALSNGYTVAYHKKRKGPKESDSDPQVGGKK
jgi:hypothetical protein